MEKDFIPYQEALELKQLGFDEPCFGQFHKDESFYRSYCTSHEQYYGQVCSGPTYSQAFRFFREKYGLTGWAEGKRFYMYRIESSVPTDGQLNSSPFRSYEEAELACVRKLIEIVKQNQP